MSSESLSSAEGEEGDEQTVGLLSNMEARADHQMAKRFRLLHGIATGLGVTLVILVLSWVIQYRNGFGWQKAELEFNWHPMLMVLGLIFIYSQAMLIYRSARQGKKKALKLTHAILHFTAFILAVIALKAAFDSHNYSVPPKPNLYTLHSWIGLITVILFSYQFVAGFISFLYPGLSRDIRSTYLPVHVHFGSAIFLMAVVTAMMGLAEKAIWAIPEYSSYSSEGVYVNFMGVVLALLGALVVYLINDSTYKRVALPEEEITLTGPTE